MKKPLALFLGCLLAATLLQAEQQNNPPQSSVPSSVVTEAPKGTILFSPPLGWHFADAKDLPKSVKVMVVGKGSREFPPSINLGMEEFSGTLKQYLKRIKEINDSHGNVWKDLGTIQVQAGNASLSQVDSKTKWGEVRMMHVILLRDNVIYIMTAASSKDDFPKFYKDFFAAFRSLHFSQPSINQEGG